MSDVETNALFSVPVAERRREINDKNLHAMLVGYTWAYGSDDKGPRLARIRFLENGFISNHKHINKQRWIIKNNIITIMNDIGVPTSYFILLFGGRNPVFLGKAAHDASIRYFLNSPESLPNA